VTAFIARDTFCGDGSSISPLQHVARECRRDGPARQSHGFPIEQRRWTEHRPVSAANAGGTRDYLTAAQSRRSSRGFRVVANVYIRDMALRQ
jgi:hypothetical protein